MLKRMYIRKIVLTTFTIMLLAFVYFIRDDDPTLKVNQNLEYVEKTLTTTPIFLLNSENFVSYTNFVISSTVNTTEEVARELLEILIIDGKNQDNIPNGFKPIIPAGTKILNIELLDKVLHVKFSEELLEINSDLENQMIETIVYTLTTIEEVDGVVIYVNDEKLTKMPHSKTILADVLDRSIGVNKSYDISNYKDVNFVNLYYINRYNDNYYYVPVTKYVNDDREKINIIIEELASSPIYEKNLMSFLNNNTKLINYNLTDEAMELVFNDYILSEQDNRNILEEVLYSISLSTMDSYNNISEVILNVENTEISKKCVKKLCN